MRPLSSLPPSDRHGNYWFGPCARGPAVFHSSTRAGGYLAFVSPERGFVRNSRGMLERYGDPDDARRVLAELLRG